MLLADMISAKDSSGSAHRHTVSINLYKGPPWYLMKPPS